MPAPLVTVVLPTWNGAKDLRRLLPALARQRVPGGVELLAVDSSSTDGSRELLAAAGWDVRVIAQADFGHGRTRTERALEGRGEYFVFLSQDALPEGEDCLAALVAPFADRPRLAGVSARVLPHPEDDLLTARTVLELPDAAERPSYWSLGAAEGLWKLEPPERARRLRFNNVASAVRADVFRRLPFPDVPFGEDFAWAARVLTAGYELGFAAAAVVRHAHAYRPREAFERYLTDAWFHASTHGWRMRPSLGSAAKGLAFELRRDLSFARRRGLWRHRGDLLRAPFLRLAQVAGQYLGSRGVAPRSQAGRPWTVLSS